MTEILNQVLPILILIGVGYTMRRKGFVGDGTVADLRKIVVNLALPRSCSLLFWTSNSNPRIRF